MSKHHRRLIRERINWKRKSGYGEPPISRVLGTLITIKTLEERSFQQNAGTYCLDSEQLYADMRALVRNANIDMSKLVRR